jgi:hypothetical protein
LARSRRTVKRLEVLRVSASDEVAIFEADSFISIA